MRSPGPRLRALHKISGLHSTSFTNHQFDIVFSHAIIFPRPIERTPDSWAEADAGQGVIIASLRLPGRARRARESDPGCAAIRDDVAQGAPGSRLQNFRGKSRIRLDMGRADQRPVGRPEHDLLGSELLLDLLRLARFRGNSRDIVSDTFASQQAPFGVGGARCRGALRLNLNCSI
jgi:hypothetical protein